ncbi:MAG: AAA family ATPase [Candidatus Muirbacterium halophilum]|nr:AAA family ATPase [Candidatus Muirbacterium halophilum]
MQNSKEMPVKMKENLKKLSPREQKYFSIMWAKYGVLYITAKPGVAKSAIAKNIADKMGFNYKDIRLSQADETDLGMYPYLSDVDHVDKKVKCLDFVIPRWAVNSNSHPTIIHFEELNRANQQVRNAALQILLERQIGTDFTFNDNVLMIASGNLGDDDMTDVEEFDAALNNRLIHIEHTLGVDEWLENFATNNCHSIVTNFIKAYPDKLYINPDDNTKAYATPRSWTMLSEFIIANYGKDSSPSEFLPILREVASGYIGNTSVNFIRYCQDSMNLSIKDVLERFDEIKTSLKKYQRDKTSELLMSLKDIEVDNLKDYQIENVIKFLKVVSAEERTDYLLYMVDNSPSEFTENAKHILLSFKKELSEIKKINKKE